MKSPSIVLEIASKRTLALVPAWPGWCRSGRDEASAMQALLEYAPRYAQVMERSGIKYAMPAKLLVTVRVAGNATTDFGAPAIVLDSDREKIPLAEAKLWRDILQACWLALDTAAKHAQGHSLRKGPRGGGRELDEMLNHVLEADGEYLKRLAWTQKPKRGTTTIESIQSMREEMLRALDTAVREGVPAQGPRGGATWPPRYFVRRVAWHALDHAWEIEDRVE